MVDKFVVSCHESHESHAISSIQYSSVQSSPNHVSYRLMSSQLINRVIKLTRSPTNRRGGGMSSGWFICFIMGIKKNKGKKKEQTDQENKHVAQGTGQYT